MENKMFVIKCGDAYLSRIGYPGEVFKSAFVFAKIWIDQKELLDYYSVLKTKEDDVWVIQEITVETHDSNILNEVTHGQFAHDQYHVGQLDSQLKTD